MRKIRFISDSTIDLPQELLKKHGIPLVPLRIFMDGKDYLDGVDIKTHQLYEFAQRTKTLPKTSAAHLKDIYALFRQRLEAEEDIIYTGISSELSSTYQSASLVRDQLASEGYDTDRIHLVDSLQLSTGIAQLVLHGVDLREQGLEVSAIAEDMWKFRERICSSFYIDTLEYLHMGGRCSALTLLASNVLRIHPQINVTAGKLVPGDRFRGSLRHSLTQYFDSMVKGRLDTIDPKRLFITHTSEPGIVAEARQLTQELNYFDEIVETYAGATIASHCGPGTLGFIYLLKESN